MAHALKRKNKEKQLKVSGFTFIRNVQMFGYPFRESILSVLTIVDEFVVTLGLCEDDTPQILESMQKEHKKIKIINTVWNENIRKDYKAINETVLSMVNKNR